MPPLSATSNRPYRRRRRHRPYTLPTQHGPRGDAPQTRAGDYRRAERHKRTPSYQRALRRTRREQRPHPSGAFGRLAPTPLARAQRQMARRAARARRALPPRPLPYVPLVRNPSRAQTLAARRLIAGAITRAVGPGGSGAQRLARRRDVERDFLGNPRMARAIRHYSVAAERHTALNLARTFGVRGPRAQRIRAGRALLARRLATDTVKPGKPHTRIGVGPASIDITNLGTGLLAQTSLEAASPENEFVRHALGDVKGLATAPFVGGYEAGAAAVEAARGDTRRARRLAAGTWEGLKRSVPGELLQGRPNAALESFRQHPLFALLDVTAAGAVAGRSAGALARTVGRKRGRVGSTVRPPLALIDDAGAVRRGRGVVSRRGSKDLIRRGMQAAVDASREKVRDAEGRPVTVMERGRRVPVLKATALERRIHARAEGDFAGSRMNSAERLVRERASREMRVRGIRGRAARDLVAMVVEGTITTAKHFRQDLESHARRLRAEIQARTKGDPGYRHTAEYRAARDRLKLVDRVLRSPRALAQAEKIVAAGEAVGRKLNEAEREAIKLGLLAPGRAGRSKLVPAAVEHLGARHFKPDELRRLEDQSDVTAEALRHGAIRHPDGRFMANTDVENFLRERGRDPESVAYLPHRLDVRGRRAFHTQFRPGQRGSLDTAETRTGEAYRKGATESSTRLIQEQGVRLATQVNKARHIDRSVEHLGVRRPDGKYWTAKEALETAQRLAADTGERMVAVRAFAAKLDDRTQKMIREDLQAPGQMETLGLRLLNDRIVHAPDEPGRVRARNVVLMPEAYVNRLQKHLTPAGETTKFLQALNRPFRFAVLAQPRWIAGNFIEPFIVRLTTVGAGVNVFGLGVDIAAATRLLRRMERSPDAKVRQAAQELRAHQLGGLFIGGRGASVRRTSDEFEAYAEVVKRLPAVKQGQEMVGLAGRALMAPAGAFFRVNRAIENVAQRAALGRDVRRDLQEFRGSWIATLRLQGKALDEVGQGLLNTATQRRFMREQHELLGKYEGYSPWMRRLVQTALPFIPWALNAARFTLWTMPAHRSIQTALLVKVNDVVAKDWQEIHRDTPPGGLRLAIPTKRGGWVDLIRYTPWGATGPVAEGEIGALDQAFPVARGAYEAMHGRDPFGRELMLDSAENAGETEPNFGQRAGIAVNDLAEALIPYVSQIRRVREGGGTSYAGSTVIDPDTKPGTDYMSGVRRTFDPFRPVYLSAPRGGGGRAARRGPLSQQDRIDAALERMDAVEALEEERNRRIDRVLQSLP